MEGIGKVDIKTPHKKVVFVSHLENMHIIRGLKSRKKDEALKISPSPLSLSLDFLQLQEFIFSPIQLVVYKIQLKHQ